MTTAITVRDDMPISDLGTVLVKSGFFSDARDASQAIVKVLAGRELGFGPIASMTGVNIIKGRVTLSANLIAAAVKRTGRYNYRITRLDDKACEIAFFEGGQEVGRSAFSMKEAEQAGLSNGENWKKYPRNMLFARTMSNGAKWYCPDVFGGPVYTPDELGAEVDGETGEVIDVTPSELSEPMLQAPPEATEQPKTNGNGDKDIKGRSWPGDLVKRIVNEGLAEVPKHAVNILNQSPFVDEIELDYSDVIEWVKQRKDAASQ